MLTIGVLVNPVAGIGGAVGLKGSDGRAVQATARARGGVSSAVVRMRAALEVLESVAGECRFKTWGGEMGEASMPAWAIASVLGRSAAPTSAADTRAAARALLDDGVDVLLFAGGDGTARDILDAVDQRIVALGVPAGVKMHSGVFAMTPSDAAAVLLRLVRGELVAVEPSEVRDIDEAALRAGRVSAKHYGYLRVPRLGGYVQHVKSGGREDERLVHLEIAQHVVELLADIDAPVLLGPGTTVAAVKDALGIDATLLGFDVVQGGRLIAKDADSLTLERLAEARSVVVLSFTGGQGFLLGRGNQQLSIELLRRLGKGQLRVVGTRTKLASLGGEPLHVDTGDPELDASFDGVIPIVAGYQDELLYRVGRETP